MLLLPITFRPLCCRSRVPCLLRKYSLSSGSLKPTWIPFMSTQAAVENLSFNMKLVTGEFLLGLTLAQTARVNYSCFR